MMGILYLFYPSLILAVYHSFILEDPNKILAKRGGW